VSSNLQSARTVIVIGLFLFMLGFIPIALAAKGGSKGTTGGNGGGNPGGTTTTTSTTTTATTSTSTTTTSATTTTSTTSTSGTLSLASEMSWNNPNSPGWCLNEDDYDYRTFSGSLSGSYTTGYQYCDPSIDYYNNVWWDAGGEGLEADVFVVGTLDALTITSPQGSTQSAVLIGQTTSRGVTTSHYAVCYVPPYHLASNTGTNPLSGGTWQLTLSGQISSATLTTRDDMADVTFQQTYCPVSEQNLLS